MSVESMTIALHHSRAKGTAKLVLLGIANHDGDGGAWPSLATLARYANVDVRNVRKALRTLEGLGELSTSIQSGGMADHTDELRPNLYRLTLRCPPSCDRTAQHRSPDQLRLQAQLHPRTNSSGGDDSVRGGRTPASGGGRTPASPEPNTEPNMNQRGAVDLVSTDRARARADHRCDNGWLGESESGLTPCPECRPDVGARLRQQREQLDRVLA